MKKALLVLLFLFLPATVTHACIWDRDTLAMERARFPEVNELIVGYFPRHSPAYYEWRREQVLAIPVAQRTPSDFDDLGVSYDKLGEHEQAIATMLEKIQRFPDEGVYETHANLGTFYIHNGDLEQGAQYIGSAIEINPDAHFGREVYQKLLVEYVIQQRAKGNTLPLNKKNAHAYQREDGFAAYVLNQQGIADGVGREEAFEIDRALKGIQGMMRFGNYESPILLEALGDLLNQTGADEGGQRLASRAYLKASYEVSAPDIARLYREKAANAMAEQQNEGFDTVEEQIKKEIAEADAYFAKIEMDEKAWIAAGKDVDALFIEKYYDDAPIMKASLGDRISEQARTKPIHLIVVALLIGFGLASALAVYFRVRRRKAAAGNLA